MLVSSSAKDATTDYEGEIELTRRYTYDANGNLTKEQVGEAAYLAADCNHDGAVNESDVLLLEQAGLMLSKIDQSQPDYMKTDSYTEYVNLIEQNPDAPDDTADEPEQPSDSPKTLIQKIIEFVKSVVAFICNISHKQQMIN